jgi:hypothetical protein
VSGDALTRGTIWVALTFYALAVVTMPWLSARGWRGEDTLGRFVRACWLLGWLAYATHVALAFHYYHEWSHAHAVRHVNERSGFGPGILFSHLFTILWSADVVWWCISSEGHARRPAWIGLVLHAYMLFMAFNATVIYETGAIRAAGLTGTALLALSLLLRLGVSRSEKEGRRDP